MIDKSFLYLGGVMLVCSNFLIQMIALISVLNVIKLFSVGSLIVGNFFRYSSRQNWIE